MRWLRTLLPLGLIAGLLVASFSRADYNVLDKGTHYQGAQGQRVTSTGHATTQEADPAMDGNLTFSSIISTASIAAGAADSSAILDTHRVRLGMLYVDCTPILAGGWADSLISIRLSIQVRSHLNGQADSASTFAVYPYGRTDIGSQATTASQTDTTVTGHLLDLNNHAASAARAPSGEFVVVVAANRVAGGWRTFTYPRGIAIPLQSIFGRDPYSPYTSIRVRNLGNGAAANRACKLAVHLVGTPL